MILDHLANWQHYTGISVRLQRGLAYLTSIHDQHFSPGRFEINDEIIYGVYQEYIPRLVDEGKWEGHRKYIDIHYMLSGSERIYVANTHYLQAENYHEELDNQSYSGKGNFFDLRPGDFAVFFPQDAHMPGIRGDFSLLVKKIVIKVLAT